MSEPIQTVTSVNPRSGFGWRLISSLVLWGIMLAVIFWLPPTALYLFMNLFIARAIWGVIGTVVMISGSWFFYRQTKRLELSYDFDILILLVFALGVFIRQFPEKTNPAGIETMAITLFGLIYVAWLGNFITRINFADVNGRYFVMLLVVVTKFTDMGAYLVGSTLGRHKMIPRISPKKTWEGTIGGLAFAVGGAVMCLYWPRQLSTGIVASGMNLTHALAIGLLLGTAAVIGDLAESLIKREANVKDSSDILPGHGGALDMLDSFLFTAPLLYIYMRLVLA